MTKDHESVRQISGVEELKALSHPLRLRLLGALREFGPATATELAKRFETETGSTSYHLRKLEQFGFVAEQPSPGRERRWQAVHQFNSWSNVALAATEEGREASGVIRRRQVEILVNDAENFEAQLETLPAAWIEAAGIGDQLAQLTPSSLTQLWEEFYARLRELENQDANDPLARKVSIVVAGFPRVER